MRGDDREVCPSRELVCVGPTWYTRAWWCPLCRMWTGGGHRCGELEALSLDLDGKGPVSEEGTSALLAGDAAVSYPQTYSR